ncbi:guanine-1-methyltransferase-domain-containing protein [Crassisporium funariophilum]|nr:guanine-1-methyltransferase-domain-containing protein [Crassisporium funariophilum]
MDLSNQPPATSEQADSSSSPKPGAQKELPTDGSQEEPKPMSKNALKKAAKAEKFAALKLERRAREKVAKKEKKRQTAEKRAAGELDDEEEEKKRRAKRPKLQFGGTVVVDLGFDDMMNDKEIVSLCSQLAYTYSVNRQASFPFSLIYTSLNGRTYDRLESMGDAGYKRWTNTKWWPESYDRLWAGQGSVPVADAELSVGHGGLSSTTETSRGEGFASTSTSVESIAKHPAHAGYSTQNSVVYLTADSEEELTELRADETYIIGGICDHNRYKNLCLNKARESGIRTARLPIGRYLASLPTRKVLTVNQVFEILVKWVETKDWEESLYSVIPKRKFHHGGKGNLEANIDANTVDDDADGELAQQEERRDSPAVEEIKPNDGDDGLR